MNRENETVNSTEELSTSKLTSTSDNDIKTTKENSILKSTKTLINKYFKERNKHQ